MKIFSFKALLKQKKKNWGTNWKGLAWQHLGFETLRTPDLNFWVYMHYAFKHHKHYLWFNFQMKRGEDHNARGFFPWITHPQCKTLTHLRIFQFQIQKLKLCWKKLFFNILITVQDLDTSQIFSFQFSISNIEN